MTLVQSNHDVFDDFMLSLDDPMPSMPNEYHDSITTPVLVTEFNDRRESTLLSDKLQQYNLTVRLYEVKLAPSEVIQVKEAQPLQSKDTSFSSIITSPITSPLPVTTTKTTTSATIPKINLQVKIEVDDQKAKTSRKSFKTLNPDDPVVFNESFTFTFNAFLSQFLDNNISFRLYKSGKYVKGTKLIGKVDLDLISLYNEPGMKISESPIPVFNESSSELVGHLKCDLFIDLPNVDKKESLLPVIRPVTPISRITNVEANVSKPVSVSVNIYSGEIPVPKMRTKDKLVSRIRSRKMTGLCVTVTLGDIEGTTSPVKRFSCPIWNECITFNTNLNLDRPPKMTIKVHDKSGSASFKPLVQTIDLNKLCHISGSAGPIYGPSYLTVNEVSKDHVFNETCPSGRLLISIRSVASTSSSLSSSSATINSKGFERSINSNTGSIVSHSNGDPNNKENSRLNQSQQSNQADQSIELPSVICGHIENLAESVYPQENEFTFLGVLYSSDMISRKLEPRKLSYEIAFGHHGIHSSPSTLDLTSISVSGVDDKSSLPDRTAFSRSTPIKGYTDQETSKLTETASVLTTASRSSGKASDHGSQAEEKDNGRSNSTIPSDKSSLTTPLKPVASDDDYLSLPLGNKRPLLGTEEMLIDSRHRAFSNNMVRRIREELEFGLIDVQEMASVNHRDTCRRFRGVLEDLMVHCNRFLALTITPSKYPKNELDILFTKYRQRELIKLSADAKRTMISLDETNIPASLSTVTGYLGRIEDLLCDPQDGFPDIMIYLLADNKRVGYLRIPASDIIFSRLENERGPSVGKVSTYYIKSIKHPELVLNRIQLYTWFGLKRHKRHSTSGLLPGFEESLQLVFFQSLDGALPSHLVYPGP